MEKKNVLCFTAHPDDNMLFAGTLLLLKETHTIYEMILTRGEQSKGKDKMDLTMAIREREVQRFAKEVGIIELTNLGQPDFCSERRQETIVQMVKKIRTLRPEIVITLHPKDYHHDHRMISSLAQEAIMWASKSWNIAELGEPFLVPKPVFSDGLILLEDPGIVIDTTKTHEKKMELYKTCYASEYSERINNFSNGVALVRGYSIRAKYAEGFSTMPNLPMSGIFNFV